MDTTNAPQIIEHLSKSLNFTPYDVKWIPQTAKFVLCGQHPKATGTIQIHQLSKSELQVVRDIQHPKGIKCSTFGACLPNKSDLAFGDFNGELNIVDLETGKIYYSVKAHESLVNAIDGIGGQDIGYGAPEIATAGRDGCVRVWDPRQKAPVLSLEPSDKESVPDAWCVAFGNSYNNDERVLVSGYDNGDLKFFDLKTNSLLWDSNLKNGVVGLEFDRKDIIMNKLVATTLEGKFHYHDMRTLHPESGYANMQEKAFGATIWGVKHLPQNRDIFGLMGGNGAFNLYKYHYPNERSIKDSEGRQRGIVGTVEILNSKDLCQQPINGFDWSKDKIGLGVLCGLDQTCKVILSTKLNLY